MFYICMQSPVPAISWRKASGDLPAGRYVMHNDNSVLQINDLQFNDQGDYVCTAANSQGTATKTIQLTVDCKFTAPPYSIDSKQIVDLFFALLSTL